MIGFDHGTKPFLLILPNLVFPYRGWQRPVIWSLGTKVQVLVAPIAGNPKLQVHIRNYNRVCFQKQKSFLQFFAAWLFSLLVSFQTQNVVIAIATI